MDAKHRKKNEDTTTDLFKYLETLPRASILALYEDKARGHFAAKTILQKLPELARQFTIRLSVCGGTFPYEHLASWSASKNKRDVKLALRHMQALAVIEPVVMKPDDDEVTTTSNNKLDNINPDPKSEIALTQAFYRAIGISLKSLISTPYHELTQAELDQLILKEKLHPSEKKNYPTKAPTPSELETFTQKRWDSVLHFLVGTDDKDYEDPPPAIESFLEKTGLMQEDPDYRGKNKAPLIISSKGYEFMLQDVHVQVWQFILKYIQTLGEGPDVNMDDFRKEAILLIICLSYCKVGKCYPAGALPKQTRGGLMRDFSLFGLLYICRIGGAVVFFPTRVAVNLIVGGLADQTSSSSSENAVSGRSASESTSIAAMSSSATAARVLEIQLEDPIPSKNHIAIIAQTNFQVCAYTTSSLHVSMLGLFCDVTTFRRLPNFIMFRITRDSIKGAFKLGIEVRQILRFLKMHAHPRLRTGDQPLIPGNVEDQIILWDRERSRVKMQEVYSLQCQSDKEYRVVKQFVDRLDAFEWGSEPHKRIMVKYEKAEPTVTFVRKWRTKVARRKEAMDTSGGFH